MIYLDVTSATSSSANAGVQRAIRGLYENLSARGKACPVRWDFAAGCYARLSHRENNFLTNPFGSSTRAVCIPGFMSGIIDPGARADRRTRPARRLPFAMLEPANTLLIPDLCWDNRIESWRQLSQTPGRKIAVFHDAMPLRIRGQANSKDGLFARYVQMLARLDTIICVSKEVEEDLLRLWRDSGISPKPTVVLPWPVPFMGPRPNHPPNREAKRILYVARLRMRKNHLVLFRACELLWRRGMTFSLDLVGMADALVDTSQILFHAAALRARGRPLRWLKHVNEMELKGAYRNCSFTVFPSQMEGFGLPILESLWNFRPVICGSNGAIGEVAAGGGSCQVDQNNVEELATAMEKLLNDSETYHRLYSETENRTFRVWDDYVHDLEAVLEPAAAP